MSRDAERDDSSMEEHSASINNEHINPLLLHKQHILRGDVLQRRVSLYDGGGSISPSSRYLSAPTTPPLTPSPSSSCNLSRVSSTSKSSTPLRQTNRLDAGKSGFLQKQGYINKSWKRRWFHMLDLTLSYSKSEGSDTIGKIDLTRCAVAWEPHSFSSPTTTTTTTSSAFSSVFSSSSSSSDGPNRFLFHIITDTRTYYLACDSIYSLKEWVDAIRVQRRRALESELPFFRLPSLNQSLRLSLGDTLLWGKGGHSIPQVVDSLYGLIVAQVCCGNQFYAVIDHRGRLYTWGVGDFGVLGTGDINNSLLPKPVDSLSHTAIKSVSLGSGYIAAAVTTQGQLYVWGAQPDDTNNTQFDSLPRLPSEFQQLQVASVSCGDFHIAAITTEGMLYTWGRGKDGRLGLGNEFSWGSPRQVEFLMSVCIVQVACGGSHTACISDSGRLYTWGNGEHGQLGHGENESMLLPTPVESLSNVRVAKVDCGLAFTLLATATGEMFAFGANDYGQLGVGHTQPCFLPTPVQGELSGTPVIHVSCGDYHAACITYRSEVYVWGDARNGETGLGIRHFRVSPHLLGPVFPARQISLCATSSIACTALVAGGVDINAEFVGNLKFQENHVAMREGYGRFTTELDMYQGEFHNDKPHGLGVSKTVEERYEGEFRDGACDGLGCVYSRDKVFAGVFHNGKRSGVGKLINKVENSVTEGVWKDDELVSDTLENVSIDSVEGAYLSRFSNTDLQDIKSPTAPLLRVPSRLSLSEYSITSNSSSENISQFSSLQLLRPAALSRASVLSVLSNVRDKYGFQISADNADTVQKYLAHYYDCRVEKQKETWRSLLGRDNLEALLRRNPGSLKSAIRNGIPAELRAEAWFILSGGKANMNSHPKGYYESLLQVEPQEHISLQIDKDLNRTFPAHLIYEIGEGQERLRRVLLACSIHNPAIGYTQSMNFICAVLLLILTEEQSFWVLDRIINKFCLDYYSEEMVGLRVDLEVYWALVKDKLKSLHRHLTRIGIIPSMFALPWLMCLFSNHVPTETLMRVWDILFYEGDKAIFRGALGLTKMAESALFQCTDDASCLKTLYNIGSTAYDCDQFIKLSFEKLQFTRSFLVKHRNKVRQEMNVTSSSTA